MTDHRPHLAVLRGNPDPEELAAVVAVLTLLRTNPDRDRPLERRIAPWSQDSDYRPPSSWSSG